MEQRHIERKLAAIVAADIAGYSRLMGADEDGTHTQLKAHRRTLVDPKIREHRGQIIKTPSVTGLPVSIPFEPFRRRFRASVRGRRWAAT